MDGTWRMVVLDLICSNLLSFMVVGLFFAGLEMTLWSLDCDGARHRRRMKRLLSQKCSEATQPIWIYETFLRLPRAKLGNE